MKLPLLIIGVLLLSWTFNTLAQEETQLCSNPARSPAERENDNCSWYNKNSCCSKFDALGLDTKTVRGKGCAGKINRDCSYEIIKRECAMVCSTDAVSWYNEDTADPTEVLGGPMRVCAEFADRFWDKCRDSSYPDYTKGVCIPLKKVWNNSKDFVEEAFGMIYVEDNTRCMNTGSNLVPPFILNVVISIVQSAMPVVFGSSVTSTVAMVTNIAVISLGLVLILPH